MIEFVALQHFVAVAQECSFTRAAERVHTSRPALTRSIKRLESQVGAQLFERTTRSVVLTPAGTEFFREALVSLERIAVAAERARRIQDGDQARIRIGICATAESETQTIVDGYQAYRRLRPECDVQLSAVPRIAQGQALRSGEIDAGIMLLNRADCHGLSWRSLHRGELMVLVPKAWDMPQGAIHLSLLSGRPWLMADPRRMPDLHQLQLALCRNAGFEPDIVGYPQDPVTGRIMVACEMGAIFINGLREFHTPETTRLVALEGLSQNLVSETVIAWAEGDETEQLRDLADCMENAARRRP
ncbi:LysR family transcriptional regulator [Novosphingobium malaysiense]|uniref:HTH lysR-type domain-containing protein n=1 Tax=Novosphingobium malaysiense TaxID=1348853 RepID=A0A0B1ZEM3_9SPHN|nr:LysR family transcriptional regulator [Novosphingobium malaysiense]KHK88965.1 hypothetical protein LK12_23005 [Novosphingobium malaysiense]